MIAGALDNIGRWNLLVVITLGADESRLWIDIHSPFAIMRTGYHPQQLTRSFKVYFVTIDNSFQGVSRRIRGIGTKYRPDGRVFRAQPPQSKAGGVITAGRAHLIEGGHAIKKPDGVVRVVFFVVFVKRIAGLGIKFNLRFRVTSIDDGLLKADFLRVRAFRP